MSTFLLTQADFVAQLPFSDKIEAAQYVPFVAFARTLDLLPLLGYATLEAVDALPAITVREAAPGLVVVAGNYVSRRDRIYRALVTAPVLPVPVLPIPAGTDPSGEWVFEPLHTLWRFYLKSWWVQQSFARFLAQHGLNLTKAGITVPLDRNQGTYDKPSAADKAGLLASVDTTAEALRSRLTRFLAAEHLLPGAGCGFGTDPNLLDEYTTPGHVHPRHLTTTRRHARRVRGV